MTSTSRVLVAQTEQDKKTVQTVLSHLEDIVVSSIHKKGAGELACRACSRCWLSRFLLRRSASARTRSLGPVVCCQAGVREG